jgi:nitroreductase
MIERIKEKLYALIFWQTRIGEVFNKVYDLSIFLKNSFTENRFKNKENRQAFLTKQYHIIEKGLALPKPRPFFGKPKIIKLIAVAKDYKNDFGTDRIIKNIQDTLSVYLERNIGLVDNDRDFHELISNFISGNTSIQIGGVKKVEIIELDKAIDINFDAFIKSRSSVRFFSEYDVDKKDLFKAIEMARYAPSVCNRQSWKVHHFVNRETMNTLLSLQNGNNGFTQSINQLLIVTGDTKKFTKLESNQVFVDGGLFAMSLLLALHSKKIASCCLNTCLPYIDEVAIKKIGVIPSSERLIMMIGIGNYKNTTEVAISDRMPVEELLLTK